ncbi:hypothetical protein ODZ83_06845 [Acaricomes phytoseiuli]|nr:hypothetical protein [Acaricomes phytoseiuli]MCW1249906.1 hypothetical protein [Acaricomes phytoseiuli]
MESALRIFATTVGILTIVLTVVVLVMLWNSAVSNYIAAQEPREPGRA